MTVEERIADRAPRTQRRCGLVDGRWRGLVWSRLAVGTDARESGVENNVDRRIFNELSAGLV